MLNVPEKVKELCRKNNSSFESWKNLRLSFFKNNLMVLYPSNSLYPGDDIYPTDAGDTWLVIEGENIVQESLKIKESLCSGEQLIFGSCEAAQIELTVLDVDEKIKEADIIGKEFTAELQIGEYRMAFGVYIVSNAKRQDDRKKVKITAYDRMILFDEDVSEWYQSLYPEGSETYTVKQLRDSLCSYLGVYQEETALINDELLIGKTISPSKMSGREILQAICQVNGVFGHFDRTGMLKYMSLEESGIYPSDTIYPSDMIYPMSGWTDAETLEHYQDITFEDYLVEGITGVWIRKETGDIGVTVGDPTNVYVIEGNFLFFGLTSMEQQLATQRICEHISGRTYRPAKIITYAMPWLEPGDSVRAITTNTEICTYVMSRTLSGIQAMKDTIEAKGTQGQQDTFDITSEIQQLKGKSAVIVKSVDEVSLKMTDLETDTQANFKVVSNKISTEVKRATETEEELKASIDVVAGEVAIKVSKGDISSQLSVEVGRVFIGSDRFRCETSDLTINDDGADFSGRIRCGKNGNTYNFIVEKDGSGSAAAGKFTWSNAGNLKLVGAELSGCLNTGTMGADVIHCNSMNANYIECNGDSDFAGLASFIDLGAARISCYSIYSESAGDTWSDKRLKKSIRDVVEEDAEKLIMGLRAVTFNTKKSGKPSVGFVAQHVVELQEEIGTEFPLVGRLDNGYLTLKYQNFIPLFAVEFQRLHSEIEKLMEEVYGRQQK